MALREKGIPFDMATPENVGSGQKIPGLAEANPRMEVPALVDGDFKIFDSKIILQYLEDKYPEHALMPKDPKARAEARMIEEVCDTGYEAINWGLGEVTWCERATGESAEKLIKQANQHTKILCDWLTEKLGDKQWFNGESFGFADICVAPYVNRSCVYGNGPAEGTPLRNWRERVMERPSVKETTQEMHAATQKMAATMKDAFKAGGGRRREYRDHRLEWMIKAGGFEVVEKGLKEDTIRFSWPGGI
jgi:RNA polymerase-associated protein